MAAAAGMRREACGVRPAASTPYMVAWDLDGERGFEGSDTADTGKRDVLVCVCVHVHTHTEGDTSDVSDASEFRFYRFFGMVVAACGDYARPGAGGAARA